MKDGELKKEEGKEKKGRSEKKKIRRTPIRKERQLIEPNDQRGKNPERHPDSNRVG